MRVDVVLKVALLVAVAAASELPGLDRLKESGLDLDDLHALPSDIQNSWLTELGVPMKHRRALLRLSGNGTAGAKLPEKDLTSLSNGTLTETLMSELRRYFSSTLPPTRTARSPVEVVVQLVPLRILSVNTRDATLELQGWMRQFWTDPRLAWNHTKWGVEHINVRSDEIWHPDTRIYEQQVSDSDSGEFSASGIRIKFTGDCSMSQQFTARVACPMHLQSYPFDTQHCRFNIGSWMYTSDQVDTDARPTKTSFWQHPAYPQLPADSSVAERVPSVAPVDVSHFLSSVEQSEFDLTRIRVVTKRQHYGCCEESFSVLTFEFQLKRGVMTVAFGLLLPIIFVTLAGFMSLLMPAPVSGARPALSVTVMLTTATVYLVASRLVPQSNSSSVMSRLYLAAFSVNFLLVLISIVTTALNSIQPEDKISADRLQRVFEHFDIDHDGALDHAEAQRALTCIGLNQAEQQKIMSMFDDNGDSHIDFEEWRRIGELTKKGEDLSCYHNYIVKSLVKVYMWAHERGRLRHAAEARKAAMETFEASVRLGEEERKTRAAMINRFGLRGSTVNLYASRTASTSKDDEATGFAAATDSLTAPTSTSGSVTGLRVRDRMASALRKFRSLRALSSPEKGMPSRTDKIHPAPVATPDPPSLVTVQAVGVSFGSLDGSLGDGASQSVDGGVSVDSSGGGSRGKRALALKPFPRTLTAVPADSDTFGRRGHNRAGIVERDGGAGGADGGAGCEADHAVRLPHTSCDVSTSVLGHCATEEEGHDIQAPGEVGQRHGAGEGRGNRQDGAAEGGRGGQGEEGSFSMPFLGAQTGVLGVDSARALRRRASLETLNRRAVDRSKSDSRPEAAGKTLPQSETAESESSLAGKGSLHRTKSMKFKSAAKVAGMLGAVNKDRLEHSLKRKQEEVRRMAALSHVQSTPQKWGRHISAQLDFLMSILLSGLFFLYLAFEFGGIIVAQLQQTTLRSLLHPTNSNNFIAGVPVDIHHNKTLSQTRCYRGHRQYLTNDWYFQNSLSTPEERVMSWEGCISSAVDDGIAANGNSPERK